VLFAEHLCLIRGGGDLGTGVALCLSRAGFPVAVCELADPLTVRRAVALSSAVTRGEVTVEGLTARRVDDAGEAWDLAAAGVVPVLVDYGLPRVPRSVVVDARMAKRPLDTRPDDAPLVVALGPGFMAGKDCHAVVETLRGSHMGRVLWEGSTEPDTGTPASVGGRTADRVLRAPVDGTVGWDRRLGDLVKGG
jgi:xanthine dehydrogenase accessory factor